MSPAYWFSTSACLQQVFRTKFVFIKGLGSTSALAKLPDLQSTNCGVVQVRLNYQSGSVSTASLQQAIAGTPK